MGTIDLHTHSTASDGTLRPAELVRRAAAAGLDVVALTDHDTADGWAEAASALPTGTRLVRGAEISCSYGGISLHLLAYLFDPYDEPLAEAFRGLRAGREGRAEAMVRALRADGHEVTVAAEGTVGRPHVARALVDAGIVADLDEAFTPEWIGTRGRYWVGKPELDAVEAVRLVLAAGGVPVFAHPMATARGRTVGDAAIEELCAAGLVGLEVDHVDHSDEQRVHLRDLARALGLVVTGSSDFHGANKGVELGANGTSVSSYESIVSRATGVAVL